MSGTTAVVSRINRLQLDQTFVVGEDSTTKPSIVVNPGGLAERTSVASIGASRIGSPNLDEGVLDGLTGPAVDEADIEGKGDTAGISESG